MKKAGAFLSLCSPCAALDFFITNHDIAERFINTEIYTIMANEVTVDPRYLSYDKAELEALLNKVENELIPASEESVRSIVSGYVPEGGEDSTSE
jgi:hypothetical protein